MYGNGRGQQYQGEQTDGSYLHRRHLHTDGTASGDRKGCIQGSDMDKLKSGSCYGGRKR